MTMQDAINKATQGGEHIHEADGVDTDDRGASGDSSAWTRKDHQASLIVAVEATFLDPAFWSA